MNNVHLPDNLSPIFSRFFVALTVTSFVFLAIRGGYR